jgi:hypothetical protein
MQSLILSLHIKSEQRRHFSKSLENARKRSKTLENGVGIVIDGPARPPDSHCSPGSA